VKSRDEIERSLSRILLDAAQGEQDATGEFMVPPSILDDLRPAERATVDAARRAVGVGDRVWEQELHRHLMVVDIVSGVCKVHRRSS
jgi:hypothetical protein